MYGELMPVASMAELEYSRERYLHQCHIGYIADRHIPGNAQSRASSGLAFRDSISDQHQGLKAVFAAQVA